MIYVAVSKKYYTALSTVLLTSLQRINGRHGDTGASLLVHSMQYSWTIARRSKAKPDH